MHRKPVVAGQFYPGTARALAAEVQRLLDVGVTPRRVIGAVAPHAGYVYSGAVAGKVFASVEVPKRCIVLSPNHTGVGNRASIMAQGEWEIPTGMIPVDEALANDLLASSDLLADDTSAHAGEHSLEVELPFLLARQPELSIVPITLGRIGAEDARALGAAIATVVRKNDGDVLIVASTDMNHYETQARTLEKDGLAIAQVKALDARGLLSVCAEHGITMCGVVPVAILIEAAKQLGASRAELIEHATSGDVSGDYDAVVGYAGFLID